MADCSDDEIRVLFVTENGYGKCTALSEFKIQSRGGSGSKGVVVTPRGGPVVEALLIAENSSVLLVTQQGKLIRFYASDVRTTVKDSSGVKVINLSHGDKVVSAFEVF